MTVICEKCLANITSNNVNVKCYGHCEGNYHLECSGLSLSTFKRKSKAEKRKWKCISCRQRQEENTDTDNEIYEEDDANDKINRSDENKRNHKQKLTLEDKMDRMIDEMDRVREEQQKTNDLIKLFQKTVTQLQDELKKRDNRIEELEDVVHEFQQHYRSTYLEVHNLEERKDEKEEDLRAITIKIGRTLGIEVKNEEIEAIHRIPTKNTTKPKPIIIQWSSRKQRNNVLAGRKNVITQNQIYGDGSKGRIYINESLTKFNKELLFEAKKKAQEKKFRFVWSREGKIFVRKEEKSKVIQIKNVKDLEMI